jgi:DNA-binding NarL/FixJ family response regulator
MDAPPHSSRVYILSRTSLFAQGIRSLLGEEPSIEIVGVESDPARAIESTRSLQPEVIIVEEPAEQGQWERLGPFIRLTTAGRIVALNLDHQSVTVYDRLRIAARGPADLVEAIRGCRNHADRGDRIAEARPIRKHEVRADKPRRRPRAVYKGGRNHEEH